MLILTRRVGESIWIGDEVKITVLRAGTSQVKLGIDAPDGVSIHREEVYKLITESAQGNDGKNSTL